MVLPTEVKVLLALVPSVVTAVMHTTMIRASMTAYSTAVGPLSSFRKLTTICENLLIVVRPFDTANPLVRDRGILCPDILNRSHNHSGTKNDTKRIRKILIGRRTGLVLLSAIDPFIRD